jgi:hypothetical protein
MNRIVCAAGFDASDAPPGVGTSHEGDVSKESSNGNQSVRIASFEEK